MKTQDQMSQKSSSQCYLLITNKPAEEAAYNFLKTLSIKISQNSPDFMLMVPEKDSLSIDEVREIKKIIFQQPLESPFKVVVIPSAESLSRTVQNSLLKTLEEPPAKALIFLVASSAKNILPTVISRVVTIKIADTKEYSQVKPTLNSIQDLAEIEDPKIWIDHFLISKYQDLLKSTGNPKVSRQIRYLIKTAQETKNMIEANVNPKLALMNLWLKTH